ncbi:hypothetical protein FN846DRAFT_910605 [Sphaerosporella brunnea]|uniref:Uncharacterized protein n=1 Tax=Sphaerosporella brunnea TaxID=1250544 RepID=A0A5J5EMK7_9PEZI|nr:hypothetical protein FN846DRAFT_910605 [Sphaerosporella brunnea]
MLTAGWNYEWSILPWICLRPVLPASYGFSANMSDRPEIQVVTVHCAPLGDTLLISPHVFYSMGNMDENPYVLEIGILNAAAWRGPRFSACSLILMRASAGLRELCERGRFA